MALVLQSYRALYVRRSSDCPGMLASAALGGLAAFHSRLCPPLQINPGEVKVLVGRNQQLIYSDNTGSENPYAKLKINIEPTRLAVKVDPVEHVPCSPVSSQGGHSMGGDTFGAFRVPQGSSQGCSSSSQGQSPTESPMQSWRNGASGPPAMAPLPPHMGTSGNSYGSFNPQNFSSADMNFDGMGMSGGMGGGMGGSMGGMGVGGSFGGTNGLAPQQQQQSAGVHSSPMRGYASYSGPNSYGQTPQQPVF